jgi:aminoglycoside phosphotransferase (APT) family kinase protein
LDRLLADDAIWALVAADERTAADVARETLVAARPRIAALAQMLSAVGIAASIQHDDLHGGNILVGPAGDRFFDWGDAVVAHPFSTLTVTFNSIAHTTDRRLDDPAFGRLRDAYLEAWTDVAPRDELVAAATLARDLGCIGRSLAWERALSGLEPDDMEGHGDAVAGWLMEFAGRLDGLPASTR